AAFSGVAQMNTGEISGSVQDALGGAVPEATVVAELAATHQKFTGKTNRVGRYLLPQLPIGSYSLTVTAPNFNQEVLSAMEVHIGDRLPHNFTVQIRANETVLIEASTSDVQPGSAEIKDVIENRQLVNMPLKSRQFLDLAMLSEGVVRPPGGT